MCLFGTRIFGCLVILYTLSIFTLGFLLGVAMPGPPTWAQRAVHLIRPLLTPILSDLGIEVSLPLSPGSSHTGVAMQTAGTLAVALLARRFRRPPLVVD